MALVSCCAAAFFCKHNFLKAIFGLPALYGTEVIFAVRKENAIKKNESVFYVGLILYGVSAII